MICTDRTEHECLERNLLGDREWLIDYLGSIRERYIGLMVGREQAGASQRQRQKPETGPPRLASGAYANDTRSIHTHMHPARIVYRGGPNGLNTVECLTTRETPEHEV